MPSCNCVRTNKACGRKPTPHKVFNHCFNTLDLSNFEGRLIKINKRVYLYT